MVASLVDVFIIRRQEAIRVKHFKPALLNIKLSRAQLGTCSM